MSNVGVGARVRVAFEGECVKWFRETDDSEPLVDVVIERDDGRFCMVGIPQSCVTELPPDLAAEVRAREICAAECKGGPDAPHYLSGDRDASMPMRIALTALREACSDT